MIDTSTMTTLQNLLKPFASLSAIAALLVCSYNMASAQVIELYPPTSLTDCNEEFENVANALNKGDELILHGGTYSQSCGRKITANGDPQNPVIIRAADGEDVLMTRPADNIDTENNIEIINSSYLVIRGIRFQGGSAGVRFVGGHHITLEDSEIFGTGNNAIPMNSGNYDSFIIRRNHIHHTGQSVAGTTEGEGMYLGCNKNACRVTNSLIEGNYIHDLRATSVGGNDGIEVKVGSYGNIIRNNVIHNTDVGEQFPCIFVYGGGSSINTVEGNVMWNCGEAIQVVSDALIRNNIIVNSWITGITAAPHVDVAEMRNVTIVNNTIVGHPKCLHIRWANASNMILANNAVYCPGGVAVNAQGIGSNVQVFSNYVQGSLSGASIDNVGFFDGGTVQEAFSNTQDLNYWPNSNSLLIGNAKADLAALNDFNENQRSSPFDIGAYETDGKSANPGWKIIPGFKQTAGQAVVRPSAPSNLRIK